MPAPDALCSSVLSFDSSLARLPGAAGHGRELGSICDKHVWVRRWRRHDRALLKAERLSQRIAWLEPAARRRSATIRAPMVAVPPFRAQLATLAAEAPSGGEWLHELKYDGYRIGCHVEGGKVCLHSRRERDWTASFPEIVAAVAELGIKSALLDGEVAVVLPDGKTSFQALQNAFSGGQRSGLTYFVFDLLYLDGRDLRALPLEQRKAECQRLLRGLPPRSPLRYSQHFELDGPMVLQKACALGAEGIVSKRRDQPYRPGRNEGWLKIKCLQRQEVVVAPSPEKARSSAAPTVRGVLITTPDRAVYPKLRFDKLALAQLYDGLAERMLLYIAGRPLTLVRCEKGVQEPDGLRSECKFLRHAPGWHRWAHEPIRRLQIQEQRKVGEYLVVDSPEGLISLIQGDITEIHVWNATARDLERPDRMVFDLDPGPNVAWASVLAAARLVRAELASRGLESWPKLTGGKGLHVVVPLLPEHGWDAVYAFSRAVAEATAQRDPGRLTLGFAKSGREQKILIDYKRNHRAAVAVAAFSTRALPGGSLSVPVSWRELKPSLSPQQYTVQNIIGHLRRQRSDPWREFWTARQSLSSVVRIRPDND
jgi:bifunctional non-homologous end joining protein LigD